MVAAEGGTEVAEARETAVAATVGVKATGADRGRAAQVPGATGLITTRAGVLTA